MKESSGENNEVFSLLVSLKNSEENIRKKLGKIDWAIILLSSLTFSHRPILPTIFLVLGNGFQSSVGHCHFDNLPNPNLPFQAKGMRWVQKSSSIDEMLSENRDPMDELRPSNPADAMNYKFITKSDFSAVMDGIWKFDSSFSHHSLVWIPRKREKMFPRKYNCMYSLFPKRGSLRNGRFSSHLLPFSRSSLSLRLFPSWLFGFQKMGEAPAKSNR